MVREKSPEVIPGSASPVEETRKKVEFLDDQIKNSKKESTVAEKVKKSTTDLNPTKILDPGSRETLDDLLKNPKLKEGVDIFTNEEKLGTFNTKIEKLKKNMQNPVLRYFTGGAASAGGSATEKIDRFADTYTERDQKTGKMKMKKMGKVIKKAYTSSGGFFSGIWNSLKSVFGYGLAKKHKKEILLWKPVKELAEKAGKYTDNVGNVAKKAGKTGGKVISEMKEHKGDSVALKYLNDKYKKDLNDLYKKDTKITGTDLAKKTQGIMDDTYKKGMKADPKGFKKRIKMGKVPGMRIGKSALGFAVVEAATDTFLTALKSGDIGEFKENFFEKVVSKENVLEMLPFVGSFQAVSDIFSTVEEGEEVSTEQTIEAILSVGFDTAFLASIVFTGGASVGAAGAKTVGKNKLKQMMVKKFGKNGGRKMVKELEETGAKKAMKKKSKSGIKGVAKSGRGEILKMSLGNISGVFSKFFPGGSILKKFLLSKQQKRLIQNVSS